MTRFKREIWDLRADLHINKDISAEERKFMQEKLSELLVQEQQFLKTPDAQPYPVPKFDSTREKWIDLDGSKTIYLRLIFGSEKAPITEVNFFNITTSMDHRFVSRSRKLIFLKANSPKV